MTASASGQIALQHCCIRAVWPTPTAGAARAGGRRRSLGGGPAHSRLDNLNEFAGAVRRTVYDRAMALFLALLPLLCLSVGMGLFLWLLLADPQQRQAREKRLARDNREKSDCER